MGCGFMGHAAIAELEPSILLPESDSLAVATCSAINLLKPLFLSCEHVHPIVGVESCCTPCFKAFVEVILARGHFDRCVL